MRQALGLLGGAFVAAVGALALGEYGFSGLAIVGAGLVLGLFVAEVVVSISTHRTWPQAAAGAGFTVAGLLGAAWTSTGHRLSTIPAEGWLALALGAAAAVLSARPRRAGSGSRPEPSSPE